MIEILDYSKCCGCTACANICAHHAITMVPDALGFVYPKVDKSKCVDCGLCEKVCSFHVGYNVKDNFQYPIAIGARHKNISEIEKSRSGATFVAVSDYILENGGIVYGVGYKEHFRICHKRATTREQRDEFRGSKYVQSDLKGIFPQIKQDLKDGYIVLFTGTPCQTSGLKSYIGKSLNKNLHLIDVVCHGVTSPFIWKDYLRFLEIKYNSTLTYVNFRDKQLYGWAEHRETFMFENTDRKVSPNFSFYKNIFFRKSCGKCPFANLKRPSDITIADFWGWEKINSKFNSDNKGCSLVLLNTSKGKELFERIESQLNTISVDINSCLQPNMQHPTELSTERYRLERDYVRYGFSYIYYKYGEDGWRFKIRVRLGKIRLKLKELLK